MEPESRMVGRASSSSSQVSRSRGCSGSACRRGYRRPVVHVPLPVTLSTASWLYRVFAMLAATQRKRPASTFLTPVTWRTPLGRRVYLHTQVRGQGSARWGTGHIGGSQDLWGYLLSLVFRDARFLSQLMVASGIPLIWHWKRATPPSCTLMDAGWVRNLGRAGEQRKTRVTRRKAARKPDKSGSPTGSPPGTLNKVPHTHAARAKAANNWWS